MPPTYIVRWEIDIEADSPQEAAAKALVIQRDNNPANSATVFQVQRQPAQPQDPWEEIYLS